MQKPPADLAVSKGGSNRKLNKCRSFHFRYMELCRAKNFTPLSDIRPRANATMTSLDFVADKVSVNDWLLISEALYSDQVLQTLAIRLRKSGGVVLDHLDTEKKARLFKQKPVIFTKFVFSGMVKSIANCIVYNKNLYVLNLEGLPLNEKYVESIAKAISSNETLREISFQRSMIRDKGCQAICNTVKYLENVEKLNLCECDLTSAGAESVANMIKIQKINRYTQGWQDSLRYRDVDPDSMPGLRIVELSRNPNIGDSGVEAIVEILKEDDWIKIINMEQCGLSDRAANLIFDCLEINSCIVDFNISQNPDVSKFLQRQVRDQLCKCGDPIKAAQYQAIHGNLDCLPQKKDKVTVATLKEQLKGLEEQLSFERVLRQKAEKLNEKLNEQIMSFQNRFEHETKKTVPEGYVLVKNESLESIIRERNDLEKIVQTKKDVSSSGSEEEIDEVTPRRPIQIKAASPRTERGAYDECYEEEPEKPTKLVTARKRSGPAPSAPNISSRDTHRPSPIRVRKAKSEMKYSEPSARDPSKKKESKSDHEFSNETDFCLSSVRFETDIGDSLSKTTEREKENNNTKRERNPTKEKAKWRQSNLEVDDISISTVRSASSEYGSSDSDTLRNAGSIDFAPMKVFMNKSKATASSVGTATQRLKKTDYGQGEGGGPACQSPRSLFLGLCD